MDQNLPILGEHEKRDNTTGAPTEYSPSAEEKSAIKLVESKFEKAKAHRKKYDGDWMMFYKMFRGKQWQEQRPSYRHSEVINMIFQSIQSTVPIQTDARPRIEFIPTEPSDRELSEILNEVCQSDWESKNWLMQLTEMVYDANFFGAGFCSMEYDVDGDYGAGEICYYSKDPFTIYPDPNAVDVNKKGRYFVEAEAIDVEVLKREFPRVAKFIKPDLIDLARADRTELDQIRYKSPVDNKTIVDGSSPYDSLHKEQALKITLWILPDDFDEERKDEKDDLGQVVKTEYVQKLKYPKGRKIVVAGGILCEDAHNPYEDGKFPYARLVNYILPREFWGISEVEQLASPQKIFNKLLSFALDVLTLMGNPIWVVDNTSGIDTDNLVNRPGLVIEKEPNSEVRREEGVQLQPYVLQLVDRMRDWFDGVSGRTEVSQGIAPGGVTAASAISSLQEAAQTRLRLKSRCLDACLQDSGQLYLSRVFQFCTVPKIYRLTNNQNTQKYFRFHVEKNEQGQQIARVQQYSEGPDGQSIPGEIKDYQIQGKFDVRVSTGSSLPFAKAEKFGQAKEMFQLGVIDEEELLKAADYPNWEAVLERVQAKRAQQAQMAQASKAQGAPPAA